MRKGSLEGCATPQILFLMNVFDHSFILMAGFLTGRWRSWKSWWEGLSYFFHFISIETFSCIFQVSSSFRDLYLFETVSSFYVNFQFLRSKKSLSFPNDDMHEFCHILSHLLFVCPLSPGQITPGKQEGEGKLLTFLLRSIAQTLQHCI